jgi:hypothetical protein
MTHRVELAISERFPFADGFGPAGRHECLVGRAHFAVDPAAQAQQGMTDIDQTPTGSFGLPAISRS